MKCRVYPVAPPNAQFWEQINRDGPIPEYAPHLGPCWLWTGRIKNGYGYAAWGSWYQAHRLVYTALIGTVDPILDLDHLCRVKACCNPAHLEPVTRRVNSRRGIVGDKGRWQSAKTHCPRGHPYTDGNVYIGKQGERSTIMRVCRTCHRETEWERRHNDGPVGMPNAEKTHCKRGHPYTGGNVRFDIRTNGKTQRACRACEQERRINRHQ